ncbi:MAG: EscU/YscU/HrcU family type III secretion system export apparatus switch protein [Saccharospirillaceae bacterium]|nr:EscU/YscU/HrcU family type III secretion system export apparatus switch protein [Saccharospirillaceae bacterium]MCD8531036.1 EscU/YscU/HrcU family type III secretion system export apparatus switch protein [Saccharospirillaceae bacterium]
MSIPPSLFEASEAIALSYDGISAPRVSARGQDELAQAIIQLALQHQVPVYENASLMRWLGQLDLGDEIPQQLYQVIAEILAFVYALEGKVPGETQKAASAENNDTSE